MQYQRDVRGGGKGKAFKAIGPRSLSHGSPDGVSSPCGVAKAKTRGPRAL
jgi:hypothetical protein